jgi:sugar lactone lactonase YvrE
MVQDFPRGIIMKTFSRIGLTILFLAHFNLGGFAQSGVITTYWGPGMPVNGEQAATLAINRPSGVAPDGVGGLYVASWSENRVYKLASDGKLSLIAGGGASGFSGDGGPATAAQLNRPRRVAVDADGNLYIVDYGNQCIRKVTAAGVISTVAGNGKIGFSGDGGPARAAQLNWPRCVAVDSTGNLYIADTYNQRIRKVTAAGAISTVAGNGIRGFSGDGGPATAAQLGDPGGVTVDTAGNLYIVDTYN